MTLTCQKHLFGLPSTGHYLNCATRAPFSRAVADAGHAAIARQLDPFGLTPDDFFSGAERVRALFAQLIHLPDASRVAIIPSVSYGMGTVAHNLPHKPGLRAGQRIVLLDAEFPSDVYAWTRVAAEQSLHVVTVPMPAGFPQATAWNEALLAAIDEQTAVVVVPPVHWMYGVRFELAAIGRRAREVGAWLIVDGTQAVGALPFDWAAVQPDALICAAYKWLMGPYSLGLAAFGPAFDEGRPLEESWMNRLNSQQFHRLTEYQPAYRPGAYRYNVGEHTHFTQMPMLEAALRQLLDWQPARIQTYCRELLAPLLPRLQALGCSVEPEAGRGHHLLGVWLPDHADPVAVQQTLLARRVSVSARGRAIRLAPHVYNEAADVMAFETALEHALRT